MQMCLLQYTFENSHTGNDLILMDRVRAGVQIASLNTIQGDFLKGQHSVDIAVCLCREQNKSRVHLMVHSRRLPNIRDGQFFGQST